MESSKQHFKVAVIGRSGAGKTTFINCLANHMHGVRFHEKRKVVISQTIEMATGDGEAQPIIARLECTFPRFKKKQTEVGGSQSQSQTTKPSVYHLENDRFKLSIIDTPGIGDTGGMEVDKKNCNEISAAVGALTDLNAVILVHKAHDCRKDVMLKYLYREVQAILPKSCKNNLLIAFTAVENPTKIDAIAALDDMGIPTDGNYFTFENNSLIPESDWLRSEGGDSQFVSKRLTRLIRDMEYAWEDSAEEFSRMFERIQSLVPVSANDFIAISVKKKAIAQMVSTHYHKSVDLEIFIGELDTKIRECKDIRKQVEENKDFMIKATRPVRKQRKVMRESFYLKPVWPGKLLFCYTCRKECHVPCKLGRVLRNGDFNLAACKAFGGNETSGLAGKSDCNHCAHSVHRHSHSHMTRVAWNYESTETYYEDEEFDAADLTKEQLYLHSKKLMEQLDRDILHMQNKKDKKWDDLNYSYDTIAYLQFKLEKLAFSADNEFLLEFLDYRRTEVLKDPKLPDQKREQTLKAIDRTADEYHFIKESVRRGERLLSPEEEEDIDYALQDIEAEQWALVGDYTSEMQDY